MRKCLLLRDRRNAQRKIRKWKAGLHRRGRKYKVPNNQVPIITIKPPKIFSLTTNYEESVTCLNQLKEAVFNPEYIDGKRVHAHIDLAEIEDLQPAAAVVLAAELDRWRRKSSIKLKPNGLKDWSDQVVSLCFDLGLFDLLEVRAVHKRAIKQRLQKIKDEQSVDIALKLVSHVRNDREVTDNLADNLSNMVPSFRNAISDADSMAISTALTEASLNSVQHAYKYNELEYPSDGNRWWASAIFQRNKDYVKFFVYDQGAGIPNTLPRSSVGQEIIKLLGIKNEGSSGLGWTDSEKIKGALTTNISSTSQTNRGKGLPQIAKAVSNKGGRLRVISGRGCAICEGSGAVQANRDSSMHIGGTLLEWTFKVGEM